MFSYWTKRRVLAELQHNLQDIARIDCQLKRKTPFIQVPHGEASSAEEDITVKRRELNVDETCDPSRFFSDDIFEVDIASIAHEQFSLENENVSVKPSEELDSVNDGFAE